MKQTFVQWLQFIKEFPPTDGGWRHIVMAETGVVAHFQGIREWDNDPYVAPFGEPPLWVGRAIKKYYEQQAFYMLHGLTLLP